MNPISRYFGSLFQPDTERYLTAWVFLRLLALIYFAAFLSLSGQMTGLVGPQGILPYQETLDAASGWQRLAMPTVFWISSDDWALQGASYAGCLFALLLFFGRWQTLSLVMLFVLYLSVFHAGQIFLDFQWDYLLLETGFLAIFLRAGPSGMVILLYHWLLFRLRFLSGVAKLVTEDPNWANLGALEYYFETQPLPHVGAWYAHHLPDWLLMTGTGFTLATELVVPFFIFLPRPFRVTAALLTIVMQLSIIATSNHNFINLLTILLCLLLLDDRIVARFVPERLRERLMKRKRQKATPKVPTIVLAVAIFGTSLPLTASMVTGIEPSGSFLQVIHFARGYGLGAIYHVFPTMQTERLELVIEGSANGRHWWPYRFRYKPNDTDTAPRFIVPHQPRLDWMMWFVPTQAPMIIDWFERFLWRLAQNEPTVTALLEENPFADEPPRFLRILAYRYRFTTPEERKKTGEWWQAEYLGRFPHQVPPRFP
uniref:Lipase maturation factor n=1 Tax=Candidatus Kentrum sp. LFY TaxID=2126342 RepID=A0A450UA02_9GAMM|nr:MAG: Lipase maturation factor [Candidatus Kentron sp. LFY]